MVVTHNAGVLIVEKEGLFFIGIGKEGQLVVVGVAGLGSFHAHRLCILAVIHKVICQLHRIHSNTEAAGIGRSAGQTDIDTTGIFFKRRQFFQMIA